MARFNLITGLAVSALMIAGSPLAAQAGFEWVAPPVQAPAVTPEAVTPAMPAMQRDHVEVMDMPVTMPETMVESPGMIMPPNSLSSTPVAEASNEAQPIRRRPPLSAVQENMISSPPTMMESTPLAAPMMTDTDVVISAVSAPKQESAYADAIGFGSDIPLALAMRQIVPPEYAFSFDPAIDQGARVTWNGGKPWNEVLSDSVSSLGAGIEIQGQTVRVMPREIIAALPERDVADVPAPIAPSMLTEPSAPTQPAPEVYVRRETDSGESFWSSLKFWGDKKPAVPQQREVVVRNPAPMNHAPTPILPTEIRPVEPAMSEPVMLSQAPGTVTSRDMAQPATLGGGIEFWQAERGDSLKNILQTWADDAGVKLYWVSVDDYNLPASIRVEGSFTDAVTKALSAFGDTAPRPVGRLHPNLPAGPAVLIVEPVTG